MPHQTLIDPANGLLRHPATSYSKPVTDAGDQALALYTLLTAWADNPDDMLHRSSLST